MKVKRVKTIRCGEAAKYICENLDEHLNSRRCQQIKRHLRECPKCTHNLADLKKIIALYRKTLVPRIPHTAHKQLFTALNLKPYAM
jgi:anti-sigma factor RsiW